MSPGTLFKGSNLSIIVLTESIKAAGRIVLGSMPPGLRTKPGTSPGFLIKGLGPGLGIILRGDEPSIAMVRLGSSNKSKLSSSEALFSLGIILLSWSGLVLTTLNVIGRSIAAFLFSSTVFL